MELLGEQDSPTVSGQAGNDDPLIEQILDNQGAIDELNRKTSSMEGSLQRILTFARGETVRGQRRRRRFLEGAWHIKYEGQRSMRVVTRAT